jgi:hypothetical protein
MKKSFLIAGSILCLFFLSALDAQETRLSYQLEKGKKYYLDLDIQQNTSSESLQSADINMYSRMRLEFRLDSTDAYGQIHLQVRYQKLLLSMLAPGLGLDINSQTGKNPILRDLIRILEEQPFRLILKESGEMVSMDGLEAVFSSLGEFPQADTSEQSLIHQTLKEAYGPNAFQGLVNLFIAYFPVVQPIQVWTRDLTYYFNTKPVQMVNRYFLTKTTGEVLTIQGMGMLNSMEEYRENLPMGEVSSSVSGSQTYDFQVDPASGWMIKCLSRQRVLITTTVLKSQHLPGGLEIPSYTETVFDVRGSIVSEDL